ncbi:MAG: mechanosensitive ion channel [Aridibacter famidurans]|nr:mechanosensitive ion channel [Aridibacter famidurans]
MENVSEWITSVFGLSADAQTRILASAIAVLSVLVVRRILLLIVNRNSKSISVRYRWRKGTAYAAFVLSVFIVGSMWFRGFQSLSTYLGLLSAGLAIALQVPLVNLAGWLFILWRRPFAVGDRIEIGEVRGDVIDQRIFMFTLMEIGNWVDAEQSTGRVIHIPNGKIFQEPLANYTEGFEYIWNEIAVLVTFESNWEKAKKILSDIAKKHGDEPSGAAAEQIKRAASTKLIIINKLTPIVYTSVKDSGVSLTVRYLCNPRRRRGSEQGIWEDVLREFSACDDIDFAYPTKRYYLNYIEGKSEARAESPRAQRR